MSNDINVNRRISGYRNESNVVSIIENYTQSIYRNIYLKTILTKKTVTEIDILFYFRGTIFIIETKNVIRAEGNLDSAKWCMTSKTGDYKTYNPIWQNKLHTRVFKNRFYERFGYFPNVISLVVVPCGTIYNTELENEVFTADSFDTLLLNYQHREENRLKYQLITFIEEGVR